MKRQHQTHLSFSEKKTLVPFCFLAKVWVKGFGWKEQTRCNSEKDLQEELKKLESKGYRVTWVPLY